MMRLTRREYFGMAGLMFGLVGCGVLLIGYSFSLSEYAHMVVSCTLGMVVVAVSVFGMGTYRQAYARS